ncbi:hypothetical protein AB0I77_29880 [Streptomyces sp. NPDC050619]
MIAPSVTRRLIDRYVTGAAVPPANELFDRIQAVVVAYESGLVRPGG